MSLNRVAVMGRLTWDPELRRTNSGVSVVSFRLAVDRDYKSPEGEQEADFIDVVAWRHTADYVARYFTKGRMAVVEGRLQGRGWTDKSGSNRYTLEVKADNVYFGDNKRVPESGTEPKPAEFKDETDMEEGELPF